MRLSKLKQLEQRVAALEEIVGSFGLRLLMLSRGLHEDVERKVHGVRTVRGNDGVLLEVVNDKRKLTTVRKKA